MALVLAMQAGRSFYVGDTEVKVEQVLTPTQVKVRVCGPLETIMTLGVNHRTELLPDVFAQIGNGFSHNTVKIALEAPRNVRILRDTLYEEQRGAHQ